MRFHLNARILRCVEEITERESQIQRSDAWVPDYDLLARMIVREGKPFKESALAVGYSASVAASGLKRLMRESAPAAEAYNREVMRFARMTDLKPLAVRRLHAEIVDLNSPLGMKAIELAGRFKETDWFVKNNGDVQIGIFAGLAEPEAIDVSSYEEKPPDEL